MRIILPSIRCNVECKYGPLLFLAGPVKGGDDWHTLFVQEVRLRLPCFYAALPCRLEEDHPLMPFRVPGGHGFVDQTEWERHFLELAANTGCLVFWLPSESAANPRNDGRPYAIDTRGEIGEWRGRLIANRNLHVVVGAEPGFPGLKAIMRNFELALGGYFPVHTSLKETVEAVHREVSKLVAHQ